MKIFVVLSVLSACAMATPAGYSDNSGSAFRIVGDNNSGALKHIQQANEDGSYTFGYESADGSFRMENRDASGLVKGKYGYVDNNGQLQEFDYVAGAVAGQAVGFQSRTAQLGEQAGPLLPVVKSSPEQRVLDFEYSSVDENRDGFPDNGGQVIASRAVAVPQTEVVRLAPAVSTVSAAAPTVVRTVVPQQTEFVQLAQVSVPTRQVEVIRAAPPTYVVQQPTTVIRSQPYGSGRLDNFIRNLGFATAAY